MSTEYKIRIFSAAIDDLKSIVNYLNTLSPQAATKYYDRIVNKISTLAKMPERCPLVRDTTLKARGYRYLVIDNYLVFFVIKGDTVQIRRLLYGKRKYNWLLEK